MITGIEIKRLRGIHEGKLADLTPLTVLVGPSGAGKSTVLEALFIGASGVPWDAIGRVVQRREELPAGAPWLFERAADAGSATASIKVDGTLTFARTCELARLADPARGSTAIQLLLKSAAFGKFQTTTTVTAKNHYSAAVNSHPSDPDSLAQFQTATVVALVEVAAGAEHEPLTRVFSRVTQKGGAVAMQETMSSLLEDAIDLRLVTYDDGQTDQPILHVVMKDYTVPLAAAGSGIYSVMRLALELAGLPKGSVALVEEPEVHQHPAALYRTAKLLLAAARRGVQVVVSTHSLELVDSLASLAKNDSDLLSVVRIVLDHGKLRSSHFSQEMVAAARGETDEDLR